LVWQLFTIKSYVKPKKKFNKYDNETKRTRTYIVLALCYVGLKFRKKKERKDYLFNVG